MVKANYILLLSIFVIFLVLMSSAYAARQALSFSDVDVKVGGKTSKNLRHGETIDDEAEPGDTIEFKIEVKSNYTSEEDLEIEDITVEVTIEEIDDGDDLDEESAEFDLDPGDDKRVTLKFQVPIEVEEDTFDVLIKAEGDDENGTDQKVEMKLKLDVEKKSHLLKITRASLSPAEVSCNRRNVQLATIVINIGNEDEEDVKVQVLNSDLGVDLSQDVEELTAEPNEEESRFSNVYSFSVPNDAEAGSYPMTFRVLYDNDRRKAEESPTLTVSDCATAKQAEEEETGEEEGEVTVITPPITGRTTTETGREEVPPGTTVTQESFLKSNAFVVGVIVAEVILVLIGIVLVVSLFRRRS
ncbi:hypothetical protein HYX02_05895 [Candidatus Woesearchaeota archaeon]|nr:hypothetical protein [Candidatus Woesearchaeota archaeon]